MADPTFRGYDWRINNSDQPYIHPQPHKQYAGTCSAAGQSGAAPDILGKNAEYRYTG